MSGLDAIHQIEDDQPEEVNGKRNTEQFHINHQLRPSSLSRGAKPLLKLLWSKTNGRRAACSAYKKAGR